MAGDIRTTLRETGEYLYLALKPLLFWRREPPVTTTGQLATYVETRSKFVAQTTLYGYIKTRAGTRYASLFEDDVFVQSVNIAKWEIYLACLCDLAIWAAATVGSRTGARPAEIEALAVHIVDAATEGEEIPPERPAGFGDVRTAFRERARSTDWRRMHEGEAAFAASLDALVEWSPIADELKVHDVEIVKNSMRFKWKHVRDKLKESMDPDAVLADWRAQHPGR